MVRVEITHRLLTDAVVSEKKLRTSLRAALYVLHVKATHRPYVLVHAILLSY